MNLTALEKEFGGEGISFEPFNGFPAIRMRNVFGTTLISLYGAHVIEFNLNNEEPVLWMSPDSMFKNGEPIRGGVPVCFPWFGAPPEGRNGAHGFVRNAMWDMIATGITPDCGNFVTMRFETDKFDLFYTITAGRMLTLSLEINNPKDTKLFFGGALHTYFNVSDVKNISVEDLDGLVYLDRVTDEPGLQCGALKIDREIDRVYDGCGSVRIVDPGFKRVIHIDKFGSNSTVVWNPWESKSQRMPDFGNEDYRTMVCVEAGKVPLIGDQGIVASRGCHELRQVIRVERNRES